MTPNAKTRFRTPIPATKASEPWASAHAPAASVVIRPPSDLQAPATCNRATRCVSNPVSKPKTRLRHKSCAKLHPASSLAGRRWRLARQCRSRQPRHPTLPQAVAPGYKPRLCSGAPTRPSRDELRLFAPHIPHQLARSAPRSYAPHPGPQYHQPNRPRR